MKSHLGLIISGADMWEEGGDGWGAGSEIVLQRGGKVVRVGEVEISSQIHRAEEALVTALLPVLAKPVQKHPIRSHPISLFQ